MIVLAAFRPTPANKIEETLNTLLAKKIKIEVWETIYIFQYRNGKKRFNVTLIGGIILYEQECRLHVSETINILKYI